MKHLIITAFLLLILIVLTSIDCQANFAHCPNDVCTNTVYVRDCGKDCYPVSGIRLKLSSVMNVEIDDVTKPIYTKINIVPCDGPDHCGANMLANCQSPDSPYWEEFNDGLYRMGCVHFAGFEKKTVKQLKEDPSKVAAYEAEKVIYEAEQAAIETKRQEIILGFENLDDIQVRILLKKMLRHYIKKNKGVDLR